MEFIQGTIEYKSWGFNLVTFCFLATVIFTLFQGWSFWKQNLAIWEKGGESVSVTLFGYWCFYFISFSIYGFYKHAGAMIINGAVGLVCIPVLIGLYKKKGFTFNECIFICAAPAMIPMIILIEQKDLFITMLMFGILIAAGSQTYEIWKNKDAGSVDMRIIAVFSATSIFWFFYAIKINNWPLIIFNPLSLTLLILTAALWLKYRRH
jgi:uncharacterized protein with PQ loop repeat